MVLLKSQSPSLFPLINFLFLAWLPSSISFSLHSPYRNIFSYIYKFITCKFYFSKNRRAKLIHVLCHQKDKKDSVSPSIQWHVPHFHLRPHQGHLYVHISISNLCKQCRFFCIKPLKIPPASNCYCISKLLPHLQVFVTIPPYFLTPKSVNSVQSELNSVQSQFNHLVTSNSLWPHGL